MRITIEQARKMIVDVRNANPNIVAGFAVLPNDQYSTSNDLYEELARYYERALSELREKKIISSTKGGYGQSFTWLSL